MPYRSIEKVMHHTVHTVMEDLRLSPGGEEPINHCSTNADVVRRVWERHHRSECRRLHSDEERARILIVQEQERSWQELHLSGSAQVSEERNVIIATAEYWQACPLRLRRCHKFRLRRIGDSEKINLCLDNEYMERHSIVYEQEREREKMHLIVADRISVARTVVFGTPEYFSSRDERIPTLNALRTPAPPSMLPTNARPKRMIATETRVCFGCADEIDLKNLVPCHAGEHFLCLDCFERSVTSYTEPDRFTELAKTSPGFPCHPPAGCFFTLRNVAKYASSEVFDAYEQAIATVERTRGREEQRQEAEQQRVLAENRSLAEKHIHHINETIMNLKCPECGQVFFDFDACFVLKCSRCGIHFCGWCVEKVPSFEEGHRHVEKCEERQNQGVWGKQVVFQEYHNVRKNMRAVKYIDEHVESRIQDEVRRHFKL